jgi:hypothetical protein
LEKTKVVDASLLKTTKQSLSQPDAYKTLTNLVNSQSPTFRVWLGRELVVVTTEPAYVETILSNSLDRFKSHNLEEIFHTGLLIAPGEYLHL